MIFPNNQSFLAACMKGIYSYADLNEDDDQWITSRLFCSRFGFVFPSIRPICFYETASKASGMNV